METFNQESLDTMRAQVKTEIDNNPNAIIDAFKQMPRTRERTTAIRAIITTYKGLT